LEATETPVDAASIADSVRLAVARTARRMRQQAGHELSPSRLSVLNTLAREGPLTPSELASIERISRPNVTRLVAKLRAQGLVDRIAAAGDRRSYLVALSKDGSALRELRRARKSAYLARVLAGATPEELELLDRATKLLLRLVEEDGEH
jgi:DNA-binding MarR family transcriptional regulator